MQPAQQTVAMPAASGPAMAINRITAVKREGDAPAQQPSAAVITPSHAPARGLGDAALRNASYNIETPVARRVTLTDGVTAVIDGATRMSVKLGSSHAAGDLDNDGTIDDAVVLISHAGGAETYFTLAAVRNAGGAPEHVASAYLGNNIRMDYLGIDGGTISVQFKRHAPDDPPCCPSLEDRRHYRLQGSQLVQAIR